MQDRTNTELCNAFKHTCWTHSAVAELVTIASGTLGSAGQGTGGGTECVINTGGGGGGASCTDLVRTPYSANVIVVYHPRKTKPSVGICEWIIYISEQIYKGASYYCNIQNIRVILLLKLFSAMETFNLICLTAEGIMALCRYIMSHLQDTTGWMHWN
jgi:hypothetical protein